MRHLFGFYKSTLMGFIWYQKNISIFSGVFLDKMMNDELTSDFIGIVYHQYALHDFNFKIFHLYNLSYALGNFSFELYLRSWFFFWGGGVVTNDLVGLTVSFIRFCTVLNLHVVVKIFFLSTHRAKIVSCISYATR